MLTDESLEPQGEKEPLRLVEFHTPCERSRTLSGPIVLTAQGLNGRRKAVQDAMSNIQDAARTSVAYAHWQVVAYKLTEEEGAIFIVPQNGAIHDGQSTTRIRVIKYQR